MSESILPDGEILFPKKGQEKSFHTMLECSIALGYRMFEYRSAIYSNKVAIDCRSRGMDEDAIKENSFLFDVLAF